MTRIRLARDRSRGNLGRACDSLEKGLVKVLKFLQIASKEPPEYLETSVRDLAYSLARVYAGVYKVAV